MRICEIFACFFILLLLSAGIHTSAQEVRHYKAVVIDSVEKTTIEKCLVVVSGSGKDAKILTGDKGEFELEVKRDSVTLHLQHVGYAEKKLVLFRSRIQGVDTIQLSPSNKQLEEIVIKTAVPPIVIKDDTTEFNIDSSMFEPFDVVEDLLGRLPGLAIDEEGKMTFHGKPITRILVDGEDLFGGDPLFSLKKLPAGLVAKIQVMDTKTLEQLFNNVPGDGEDKTLNIKLKEGTKTFGSADATAGTKNQLGGSAMLSRFDKERRLSIMASTSSSNKIALSKVQSGPSSTFTNASTNYGNKWGGLRINGSYTYNENSNSNRMYRERTQVITADTAFFTKAANQSNNSSAGHRFSLNANWFIDSTSSLDMSLSYTPSKSKGSNSSLSSTLENEALRNESLGSSQSLTNNKTMAATMLWTKRLNRKGRSISVNARTNVSGQESNVLNRSINTYFKAGAPFSGDTLERLTKTNNDNKSHAVSLNYMEPISKTLRFTLRGDFDFNKTFTNREIYNLDSAAHLAEFDSLYSAEIVSSANTKNLGASLVYNNQKWNVSSGLTTVLQQAVRVLQNETIQQDLLRYSPSLNASYRMGKGKIIRANFSANTMQPAIDQLQPVPDNSNPLYVRIGNPDLRTSFSQTYGIGYNFTDTSGAVTMGINYSPVSNQIVNAVYYDEFRRQTSRFINVNGVYTIRGNFSFSKTRRMNKQFRSWGISSGVNYGQQVYFQNNNQYYTRNYTTNGEFSYSRRELMARATSYSVALSSSFSRSWTPGNKKILNTTRLNIAPRLEGSVIIAQNVYVTGSYNVWYNKFDYHSNLQKNNEYSIHRFGNNINFRVKKNLAVQSNLQYQYNTMAPLGTNKGILTFNVSSSVQVLKGKGQLIFAAFDLFSTNTNLRRITAENYIEDVQVDNLQNYFTLKFQYNFNKLERKKQPAKNH